MPIRTPEDLKVELISAYPGSENLIRSVVDWDHLHSPETLAVLLRGLGDSAYAHDYLNLALPLREQFVLPLVNPLSVNTFDSGESGVIVTNTHTFSDINVSAGLVVVAVSTRGAVSLTTQSVTMGGVAMTNIVKENHDPVEIQETSMWTGTTSNALEEFVVTADMTTQRIGITVWSIGQAVLVDTTEDSNRTFGLAMSGTLDVKTRGLILAHATTVGSGGADQDIAWTGATERLNEVEISGNYWHSAADKAVTSDNASYQLSLTVTGTNNIMTAASFEPA